MESNKWLTIETRGDEVVLTKCSSDAQGDIAIPKGVIIIGENAFSGCDKITSVIIPDSVTDIEDEAFNECENLLSIILPKSVGSIGDYAFNGCIRVNAIRVDSRNQVYDSRENCNAVIESSTNTLILGCKNTLIPDSVTSIGKHAFGDCNSLKSIVIPNGVTSIGYSAFLGCAGLKSIIIPKGLTKIDNYAFGNCESIKSIVIPNTVTNIGSNAFYGCKSLESISIPDSVTSIDDNAFEGCESLKSITIPERLSYIFDDYPNLSISYVQVKTRNKRKKRHVMDTNGYLTIAINSAIDADMEFLMDDLDENPQDEYLNWLLQKKCSTSNLNFDCPTKLVEAIAEYKKNDKDDIVQWKLEEIGEQVGEEELIQNICNICNNITIKLWAKEFHNEYVYRKDWRDGFFGICEVEKDKEKREQWKALLKRNISDGLATDYYTLEEFKEDYNNKPRPKSDQEWEKAYDDYIDDQILDYYTELDDNPQKEQHLKDSGLKSFDEVNELEDEYFIETAECWLEDEYREAWCVTDFGIKDKESK